jgi:triacylglycerol lipase
LQLQQVLAEELWTCGSDARWVEAIVSIAGVINGSTLTYLAVCDPKTGKLKQLPSFFIKRGLDILKMIGTYHQFS